MKVLVTGGASGIGFGIAEQFANAGHELVLADLDGAKAAEAAAKLPKAIGVAINVTDATAAEALAKEVGAIDVLVNNAGIQHVARLEDFPADKWRQLIDIMLVGPMIMTKAFLPAMREQNFGRIINIGSIHSLVASPYKSAYVSAKHGLLGFAKTLALELGEADITVNTICPAYVKTPLVDKQIADQARENNMTEEDVVANIFLAPMAKKAFITLEEIAGSAMFLISPAARNITAQTLVLDGGWTAR
ncbi:3-hydroxybutyrate dehydrogenase [Gallaecimonas pentaromativorans]|uniref:3-hydroxybutyrate dehydrogenase n=1 Tax=Gallaecimonas pentaromativorans TaxID=584787 RepID=A0A3N1PJR5_9GAMM|nr:3-hydroxybutyrate dehydrogenase [Gallaecimonas pentaromativorans]MED5523845.1 3-hydroxybutyrate dehydrogenase [Pseudomonadota bacterium]ROQ24776.1 3-hydroxybutyrate dehydrogenase [Gallaecimonas pentaromativorans]